MNFELKHLDLIAAADEKAKAQAADQSVKDAAKGANLKVKATATLKELQTACKGLALGKSCGMKHAH